MPASSSSAPRCCSRAISTDPLLSGIRHVHVRADQGVRRAGRPSPPAWPGDRALGLPSQDHRRGGRRRARGGARRGRRRPAGDAGRRAGGRPRRACRAGARGRAGAAGRGRCTSSPRRSSARSTARPAPTRRRSSRSATASRKGQVLCIVEAMKLMNEIEADVDGDRRRDPRRERRSRSSTASRCSRLRRAADPRVRPADVQEDPDRQPRRDRAAHHPRLPRARHRDGRRLLEADRDALHVALRRRGGLHRPAAARRELPQHPARSSRAAEITGADAIHPGYGFLAENAHFAEVCGELQASPSSGPPPEAIRRMGDKAAARETATRGRACPCVPGSDGSGRRRRTRRSRSRREIGYPGASSRRRPAAAGAACASCATTDELAAALRRRRAPRRETAFGNADVYLEKYLERAAAHRGPGPRRPPRQRRPPRRARVLDPAPAPEADRGVARRPALTPRAARARWARRRSRLRRARRLHERRHDRVPARPATARSTSWR